jgi:alpha-1,2-mannosyltransferase
MAHLAAALRRRAPSRGAVSAWLPPPAVAAALAWAVAIAVVAPLVIGYLTNAPDQRLVDLDVYRTGGESVLHGQALYFMRTQPPQLLLFTYPPVAAVFAVPFAMLPWPAAQLVWVAFIYVPLAITVWFAFRPLRERAGRYGPAVAAVAFTAGAYLFPMRDQMRFGQIDILLVAMCIADCAARSPRWPRGALIGLATALKLVPGVFIIYLWLSGRRRAARTAAIAAACWTAGAFLLLPRDSLYYWTRAIFDSGRLGSNTATSNQSLRGLLLRFFLPSHVPALLWLAVAAVVTVYGFAAARRVAAEGNEMAGVAITGLLAVLLSPVAWIHHLAWVAVVLGVIVGDGRDRKRVVAALATAIFFTLTIPWWGVSLLAVKGVPKLAGRAVQGGFGFGAVALIPVIGWSARRAGPGSPAGADRVAGHPPEAAGPQPAGVPGSGADTRQESRVTAGHANAVTNTTRILGEVKRRLRAGRQAGAWLPRIR